MDVQRFKNSIVAGCVPAIPTDIEQLFTALKKGINVWYMDCATIYLVIRCLFCFMRKKTSFQHKHSF